MSMNPVLLNVFSSVQQAHAARNLLELHGIATVMTGDQLAADLSIYGTAVAKVEVYVDESRAREAMHLVATLEREQALPDPWGAANEFWWKCPTCGEVNAPAFEECWSCRTPVPENPERVPGDNGNDDERTESPVEESVSKVPQMDEAIRDSPYRPPQMNRLSARPIFAVSEMQERAWRSCIYGLFAPVPCAFYAVWVCGRCVLSGHSTRQIQMGLALMLFISLLVIGGMIGLAIL